MTRDKAIKILEEFKVMSGLVIQVKKTQVVLLGKKYVENEHKLCRNRNLKWSQQFRLLGLDYDAYNEKDITVNYENKLDEIFEEMSSWRNKFISIKARKNIVSGLFISKLTHIAAVLPNLTTKEINKIESRLYEFIWGGTARLERQESKLSFEMGGLNFPDLKSTWTALKLSWIRRLEYGKVTKWYEILSTKVNDINPDLEVRNITSWSTQQISNLARKIPSKIWKSIFTSLRDYIRKDLKINKEKALKHNSWGMGIYKTSGGNKLTLAKVKSLEANNILPTEFLDIQNGNVSVKANDLIIDRYTHIKRNHINNALDALKNYIQEININSIDGSYLIPCRTYLQENIHRFKKGSGWWAKSLKYNENILKNVRKREETWSQKLNNNNLDRSFWDTQYKMVHKINFDNKIQITQFQIMKRNIKTNHIVNKFLNHVPRTCTLCCTLDETPEHLFYQCPETQNLLEKINRYMPTWTNGKEFKDITDFLFISKMKKLDTREVFKLMIKYFIWRTRCSRRKEDLTLENFKQYLYNFMKPHKKAKSLNFLENRCLWVELEAAPD